MLDKSLHELSEKTKLRKPKTEHSVLNRLNCHKEKFDELYRSMNVQFKGKNRNADMLPFKFNRVKLNKNARPFSSLRNKSGSFMGLSRPQNSN